MAESNDWLSVGKIVGVQLQGNYGNPASDFERFRSWILPAVQPRGEPMEIQPRELQPPGKSLFVVQLDGIDSRSAAEALIGQGLLWCRQTTDPNLQRGISPARSVRIGSTAHVRWPCHWHGERPDQRRKRSTRTNNGRRPQKLRRSCRRYGLRRAGCCSRHHRPAGAMTHFLGHRQRPLGQASLGHFFRTQWPPHR